MPNQQKTPEEQLQQIHEQFNRNEINSRTLFEQVYQHCKVLMSQNKTLQSQLSQLIEEKKQWGDLKESKKKLQRPQ